MLTDEAFGIVPILSDPNGPRFLLIQHHAGHWGFPKGHADSGESALEAARREFTEETGIRDYGLLEDVSFSEHYTFSRQGKSIDKTVTYFVAWVRSPIVECQAAEIKAYAWAEFETAIAQLSFNGSRQVLTQVHQYLQKV